MSETGYITCIIVLTLAFIISIVVNINLQNEIDFLQSYIREQGQKATEFFEFFGKDDFEP